MTFRVLVVDDEASLQFALKELLSRQGFQVETAKDGFDALAILGTFDPHVVLVDYSMPKMNGLELLQRARANKPDALVIMMTAYGTEALAVECMKSGAYDYFVKPFNNDDFEAGVAEARRFARLRAAVVEAQIAATQANAARPR